MKCPAGKIECEKFIKSGHCIADDEYTGTVNIINFEQCPWPSMQKTEDEISCNVRYNITKRQLEYEIPGKYRFEPIRRNDG